MIVFDLACDEGHRFEGWFGSSADFERQREAGLIACPQCGSGAVDKAVMAPAVARKGNQLPVPARAGARAGTGAGSRPGAGDEPVQMSNAPLPPRAVEMMRRLAAMQTRALESSRWVGETFAEDARAMHYGERTTEAIHGEATLGEAEALLEEGIAIAPLPFPVVPPGEAN